MTEPDGHRRDLLARLAGPLPIRAEARPDTTPVFVAPDADATLAARGPAGRPRRPATVFETPDTGEPPAYAARRR